MSKLRELPIIPHVQDNLAEDYVAERDHITGPDQLPAFVHRWQALWGLADWGPPHPVAQQLAAGGAGIDYETAWQCMQQCRRTEQGCPHVELPTACPGIFIMLPGVFATVMMVIEHFGVPLNTGLVQLQRALHNFDDEDASLVF